MTTPINLPLYTVCLHSLLQLTFFIHRLQLFPRHHCLTSLQCWSIPFTFSSYPWMHRLTQPRQCWLNPLPYVFDCVFNGLSLPAARAQNAFQPVSCGSQVPFLTPAVSQPLSSTRSVLTPKTALKIVSIAEFSVIRILITHVLTKPKRYQITSCYDYGSTLRVKPL